VYTVFGLVVFVFLFSWMMRVRSRHWIELAKSYAGEAGPARDERSMRTAVLIGLGALNSHKGTVTIGVHDNGVSFRAMPVLEMFCDPLFVPYGEISGWGTTWYLNSRSSELHFRRAPQIKMVLPAEDAEWIQKAAGQQMRLRQDAPPQGNAGQGWRAVFLLQMVVMLIVIGWVLSTGQLALFQAN